MWKCSHCNESVEDNFETCWNCYKPRDPNAIHIDDEPDTPPSELPLRAEMPFTGAMTRHEIATIICKTLALLIFAQAAFLSITGIVAIVFMFFTAPFRGWHDWHEINTLLILSIPMLASLSVGLIYWKHAYGIGKRMVSSDPTPVTTHPISISDIMMVAFSTAGIFILVDGVRDMVGVVFLTHIYDFSVYEFWYNPKTCSALVQLMIGMWLMLGSHGIVRAVYWFRTAGIPELQEGPESEDGK